MVLFLPQLPETRHNWLPRAMPRSRLRSQTVERSRAFKIAVPGFTPPTINTVASRVQNPRYQEWNLELQQALGQKMSLSLNYVGNHGVHEVVQNPGLNAFCDITCQGLLGTYPQGSFGDLPTTATDPRFSTVTEIGSVRSIPITTG